MRNLSKVISPPRHEPKPPRITETEHAVLVHVDTPGGPVANMSPGAWWNNIARAWFVERDGEVVRLHPQPPAPPQDVREVFARLGVPVIEARGAEPRTVIGEGAEARPVPAVRVDL